MKTGEAIAMMKRIALALVGLALLWLTEPAQAQTIVVASCPSAISIGPAGSTGRPYAIDVNGNVCSGGSSGGGDASAANQVLQITQETAFNTNLGAPGSTACATDTGSCSGNALLQRLAQRLSSIIASLGTPYQAGGALPLPTGAATSANQSTEITSLATIATNTTGGATAANQTTMATNQTAVQTPVAPGAATATKANLTGCQATSAAINPTTGQQGAVICDLNNNLLVSSGGAPNLLTAQVSVATSDTATVAARALRRSVTITNVTGTQDVYCSGTTATTANGQIIPGVKGASWTTSTTAAIRCIAVTGAQTVSVAEVY